MQQPAKARGLVADLWPLLRLMQLSGHFIFEYRDGAALAPRLIYSCMQAFVVVVGFATIVINMAMEAGDVNDLSANTITTLFFVHSITKLAYFALRSGKFYRTLATWNQTNSHPLFAESQSRFHSLAVTKMRRLLVLVCVATLASIAAWTILTFFEDGTKEVRDPDNGNETIFKDIPRLPLRAWYPWDAKSGMPYMATFLYQLYWLLLTLFHANLPDVLFCCWLIYACEQLVHLKDVMRPLMELSAALDTVVPHSADLFRAVTPAVADDYINEQDIDGSVTIRSIYSNQRDFSGFQRGGGAVGPNGLSKKQEVLVRSAIKYWVERHKHVVRFVGNIGDAYGSALLLHMLTSTVTLTLLAYQATKISAVDVYACSVLGYLGYTLAQVFLFCVFGNRLIEESSSVMEAAYSCHWYDGSEEAKTFVQIVCQQCQKSLSISGAKFFTVSLDLFASVLGAVVTYFMVLVQLK